MFIDSFLEFQVLVEESLARIRRNINLVKNMYTQKKGKFTLGFSLLSFTLVFSQDLKPICLKVLGNNGDEIGGCESVLHLLDNVKMTYQRWLMDADLREGITQNNITFTNATVKYNSLSDIGILAAGSKNKRNKWVFSPKINSNTTFPLLVKLAYLPYPANDVVIFNVPSTMPPNSSVCTKEYAVKECSTFNSSKMEFRRLVYNKPSIRLTLRSKDILVDLMVELLSAPCFIHCNNGTSSCGSDIKLDIDNLLNSSHSLIFEDLKPRNYCVRLFPSTRCCGGYSQNVVITNVTEEANFVVPIKSNHSYLYFIWIGIIVFLFSGYLFLHFIKGKHRASTSDGTTKNSLIEDDCNAKKRSKLLPLIKVLLLYPKIPNSLQNELNVFKDNLKLHVSELWDPYDEDVIDSINESWWRWLENILKIPTLRIIVVETEETIGWFADEKRINNAPRHYIEEIIFYALARIKEDQYLCRNYRRLFRIRFESDSNLDNYGQPNALVPFTCYEMPQHLPHLIRELTDLTQADDLLKDINEITAIC